MFQIVLLLFFLNILLTGSSQENTPSRRIFYGINATIEDHPYQLYVGSKTQDNKINFICGAVLISEIWALTCGNCASRINKYVTTSRYPAYVYANATDYTKAVKKVTIQKVVVHPKYHKYVPVQGHSDIGLIRLAEPLHCLNCRPIAIHDVSPPVGSEVTVTGWGERQSESKGESKNYLQKLFMVVQPVETCYIQFSDTPYRNDTYDILSSVQFCAEPRGSLRYNGQGPCGDDQGGPVVYDEMLVGIIPMTKSCPWDKPYLFADVTKHIKWITEVTGF